MAYLFNNEYPYTDFHELNLDWVINQVKDLADKVQQLIDEYKTYEGLLQEAKDYTDERINEVRSNILALTNNVVNLSNRLDSEVVRLMTAINDGDSRLQSDIDTKYIRNQQAIASQWEAMKQYIAGQVFDIKVRNFFTGQLVSIQSMFDYLAGLHLTDAGTYAQVSNINTYQHYVDKMEEYTTVIQQSLTFFQS